MTYKVQNDNFSKPDTFIRPRCIFLTRLLTLRASFVQNTNLKCNNFIVNSSVFGFDSRIDINSVNRSIIDMGDGPCCDICPSTVCTTSVNDNIFLKHLEDVLDPKPYVRDNQIPVTFENTHLQTVIKYSGGSGGGDGDTRSPTILPLKPYQVEDDFPQLKIYLDQNMEEIQKLGQRQLSLGGYVKQIQEDIGSRNLARGSKDENYIDRFKILLWIEEHFCKKELERHNQRDVTLITDDGGSLLYGVDVLGLSDGRPSLILNDYVRIHKEHDKMIEEKTNLEKYSVYESVIRDIKKFQDVIYVAPNRNKFEYQRDEKVGVEFVLNRRPYQLSHRALDQVRMKPSLFRTLFPKKPEQKIKLENNLLFVNKKISKDDKQKQAIESIILQTSGSAPYILIGPPGTGKTATLVEAIYQLWKRSKPNEWPKICICAPSNPAIDVIVKRLLSRDRLEEDCPAPPDKLPENVIRIYAKTGERDKNLLDCSTNDVNVGTLKAKHIIATTTVTAGWLLDKGFGRNWFDYLFIDEAGQGTETDVLIPIAGFLHDKCNLVLAGDPKQLGPVVTSPLATALNLNVSLMERLHLLPIYRNRSNRNSFLLTTTLKNNYRSHSKIIHIPNIRFYHGQLQALGESKRIFEVSDSDWEELSRATTSYGYPIIFRGVKGKQRKDGSSPSFFNVKEIIEVKNYIEKLLGRVFSGGKPTEQENIGIISPYRNQVEKIKKYLDHRKWNGIRVGSVESFQGSEKPIIIISTVRSKKLGFLKNARRFNVAVTRAMALLIVIGHPDVLYSQSEDQHPNYWRELIDECYGHHSCKGELPKELKKN